MLLCALWMCVELVISIPSSEIDHTILTWTKPNRTISQVVKQCKHIRAISYLVVHCICLFVCLMVFNATFNNISAISWRSVLLVEENGRSGENTDLSQVTDKLYHVMLYTSPWSRFELTTPVVSVSVSFYHVIASFIMFA